MKVLDPLWIQQWLTIIPDAILNMQFFLCHCWTLNPFYEGYKNYERTPGMIYGREDKINDELCF